LQPALPFVLHHHERYDGTGYPHQLKSNQIPLAARILACADSFDAMTSNRPYRFRQLSQEEAITELEVNSGKQFDPQIVKIFIKILHLNS
jgi:HD-GYP domain-containing protein (c-di-GMP phosphodiesterase class II)